MFICEQKIQVLINITFVKTLAKACQTLVKTDILDDDHINFLGIRPITPNSSNSYKDHLKPPKKTISPLVGCPFCDQEYNIDDDSDAAFRLVIHVANHHPKENLQFRFLGCLSFYWNIRVFRTSTINRLEKLKNRLV